MSLYKYSLLSILKQMQDRKNKTNLWETQMEAINHDINSWGNLFEIKIDLNDTYEYKINDLPLITQFIFKDDNNVDRLMNILKGSNEVKVGLMQDGKIITDKPDREIKDPKVINTFSKILIDEILNKEDFVQLKCIDEFRFRLFRAIIASNLDKNLFDIFTENNDILIYKKQNKENMKLKEILKQVIQDKKLSSVLWKNINK